MQKKILIVDNNQVILYQLTNFLTKKGYRVASAEDGLEALRTMESFRPALMFVDLVMPKINGEKLCRIIRKMPEFDAVFIVVISGIAAEKGVDFRSFGANACIAKVPFGVMQTHISTVMAHFENGDFEPLARKTFGSENIHRRNITSELLASQKHFEVTLDNMLDGFLELTLEAKVIFANKAAAEILGLPETDLLASFFPDIFPPKDRQIIEDTFARLQDHPLEIGENPPIILHQRCLFIRIIPFADNNQKLIMVLLQDITRQKRQELELIEYKERLEEKVAQRTEEYEKANEQLRHEIIERSKTQQKLELSVKHWRETFDVMGDLVSVVGKDMRFVKVNKPLAVFLGQTPADLVGEQCFKWMHRTDAPWPHCPHLKALESGQTVTREIVNQHLGKTLLVTCSPFFDKHGEAIGTVNVARDITEQKKMAAEKEKLIQKLQDALTEIKTLKGILPVCCVCGLIRDDTGCEQGKGQWMKVDQFITRKTDARVSHSYCPTCYTKAMERLESGSEASSEDET